MASCPLEYWSFCVYGLVIILYITICLVFFTLFGLLIYIILKAWIKANWRLSQRHTEYIWATTERQREQKKLDTINKIDQQKIDRKRYSYCVGDEAEYTCKRENATNRKRLGQKCKIAGLSSRGNIYPHWENKSKPDNNFILASSFKFFKKPILKKPKLSKLRQEEISAKKKK